MKRTLRVLLMLVLIFGLLSGGISFPTVTVRAEEPDEVRYTKKVVSVLYDNSGSMRYYQRYEYALYSLQMLMSLLGSEDTLIITPMEHYSAEEINLAAPDRNAELERALNRTFLAEKPQYNTPSASISKARDQLVQRGLKKQSELVQQETNTEYWLVIMTDGAFEDNPSPAYAEQRISDQISEYPSMRTIYLGFGGASDLSNSALKDKYPFTPYLASSTTDLISVMQEVTNQMSGRFSLPGDAYEVNGNTVTVNLDKYEYSLKSISVFAQNCGATLTEAKYNGSRVTVSQGCVIRPRTELNIKNGYSGVIQGDPYLNGGTLTLTFDATVKQISLLAEPALFIRAHLEHHNGTDYERVDMQYINSNLSAGDKVRVVYEVFEQANGEKVDPEKLFGSAVSKVTYNNQSYVCGQDFPLVAGSNEISVAVSVMDGKFTMYDSIVCIVEENPTYYRVEATYDRDTVTSNDRKVRTVYTVYVNNMPLTAAQLSSYQYEVSLTLADGTSVPLNTQVKSSGQIEVTGEIPFGNYGVYTEYFKVVSDRNIWRDHTHTVTYNPTSILATLQSGGGFTVNESQLAKADCEEIKFELTADQSPLRFDSGVISYQVLLDGYDVTAYTVVDGNVLTYTPRTTDTGKGVLPVGEKKVELLVQGITATNLSAEAHTSFTLTPSVYAVEAMGAEGKPIDRFDLEASDAVLYYRIIRDGEALSFREIELLLADESVLIEDEGTFSGYFWLPCGIESVAEEREGHGVIAIRVVRDIFKPLHSFLAMCIFDGDKPVTVSFRDSQGVDSFVFESSPFWSYLWRILVILLIIHLTLFLIGFCKSRNFTPGTFVKIYVPNSNADPISVSTYSVNLTFSEKWLWHWKRLCFVKPIWCNQEEQEGILGMVSLAFMKSETTKDVGEVATIRMFDGTVMRTASRNVTGGEADNKFNEMMATLSSSAYRGDGLSIPEITARDGRRLFVLRPTSITNGHETLISDFSTYALLENNKISEVLFFVRRY